MRYFEIRYDGELLMEVFAHDAAEAKQKAQRELLFSGRGLKNLARLEAR